MTKVPKYWNKAKRYLSKRDKIMSRLIKNYQSPDETILTSRKDIFFSLCKSIIGQQISVAAANSVFLKFKFIHITNIMKYAFKTYQIISKIDKEAAHLYHPQLYV